MTNVHYPLLIFQRNKLRDKNSRILGEKGINKAGNLIDTLITQLIKAGIHTNNIRLETEGLLNEEQLVYVSNESNHLLMWSAAQIKNFESRMIFGG